jgi:EpsI family protein
MSGSLTVRLTAAVGIIAVCFGVVCLTALHGIPSMKMPAWHLKDMPKQLGGWTWDGTNKQLDARMFNAIGAKEVEDREYRNSAGDVIILHSALFDDAEKGMRHSPINCYRESGWEKINDQTVPMKKGSAHPEICIVEWEKGREQCMTGHWYQLGEEQVFDRGNGLMGYRLNHIWQNEWPPMVKVLLQVSVTDSEKNSANLKDFGLQISRWLSELRKKSSLPNKSS